jgi:hypothetical protein
MAGVGVFVQASTLSDALGWYLTQKHVHGQFNGCVGGLSSAVDSNRIQALFRP